MCSNVHHLHPGFYLLNKSTIELRLVNLFIIAVLLRAILVDQPECIVVDSS